MRSVGTIRNCGDCSRNRAIPFRGYPIGRSSCADASGIASRSTISCRQHRERKMSSPILIDAQMLESASVPTDDVEQSGL